MNKRGLTLTELLASLAILSTVLLLASTSFFSVRNKVEQRNLDNNIELIKMAATKYYDQTGNNVFLVRDLLQSGYLSGNNGSDFYINNEDYQCYIINYYEIYQASLNKYQDEISLTKGNCLNDETNYGPKISNLSGNIHLTLNGKFKDSKVISGVIKSSLGDICSFDGSVNDVYCKINNLNDDYQVFIEATIMYENNIILKKKLVI